MAMYIKTQRDNRKDDLAIGEVFKSLQSKQRKLYLQYHRTLYE